MLSSAPASCLRLRMPACSAGLRSRTNWMPRRSRETWGKTNEACVAAGLLSKKGSRYSLTATARIYLTPGSSTDLSGALRYNRDVYAIWGRLPEFLRTGKPVERPELHLGEDTARTRAFVLAMHDKAK